MDPIDEPDDELAPDETGAEFLAAGIGQHRTYIPAEPGFQIIRRNVEASSERDRMQEYELVSGRGPLTVAADGIRTRKFVDCRTLGTPVIAWRITHGVDAAGRSFEEIVPVTPVGSVKLGRNERWANGLLCPDGKVRLLGVGKFADLGRFMRWLAFKPPDERAEKVREEQDLNRKRCHQNPYQLRGAA